MMTTKKTKTVITKRTAASLARRGALLLAFVLLVPSAVFPQKVLRDHYALIVATVWNSANQPMYGIKVQIRRAGEKKVLQEYYSNHTGEVAFRVPEGKADYVLTADVKVSKGKTKPQVTAHVENDERTEVSLHLTE